MALSSLGARAPEIVRRWLSEFKSRSQGNLRSYAAEIRADPELFTALEEVIGNPWTPPDLISAVSHQLYELCRCREPGLKRYVVELLPTLITTYLLSCVPGSSSYRRDSDRPRIADILQTCLLGIHVLFVPLGGKRTKTSFSIPAITEASVFHDGVARPELYADTSDSIVAQPSTSPESSMVADNKFIVLHHMVAFYNDNIAHLSLASHASYCRASVRLASLTNRPRIYVKSYLLTELLHGINYIMFTGQADLAHDALDAIERRAVYDLMTDVLLFVNAMRQSVEYQPPTVAQDVPDARHRASSVMLYPGGPTPVISGSTHFLRHGSTSVEVITNANFRPEKPPDDITVLVFEATGNTAASEVELSNAASQGQQTTLDVNAIAVDFRDTQPSLVPPRTTARLKWAPAVDMDTKADSQGANANNNLVNGKSKTDGDGYKLETTAL